jgi:hypothetical protein
MKRLFIPGEVAAEMAQVLAMAMEMTEEKGMVIDEVMVRGAVLVMVQGK